MIALLDNGQDLDICAREIGVGVGQLLTPLTRYANRSPDCFAIDNGGFDEPEIPGLFSLLKREERNKAGCLFVAVPDIVFSAPRTLELFAHFKPKMPAGWPLALVCQDGQENLPIPWDEIAAVFIGGSTNWKCSVHVERIVKTAKVLGKHTHMGRVNTPERWQWADDLGIDTGDGTGLSRYTHMRERIAARGDQPLLFGKEMVA